MKQSTLKDYFNRIEFQQNSIRSGSGPSIELLQGLHRQHTRKIPFENLNPLLGIAVDLDADAIEKKLIYAARGGYCYEQNLLFFDVLTTLGFDVTGLEARVLGVNEPALSPRTHMLLLVKLDKTYIVDVGFGGFTPAAPVLLAPEIEQSTSNETYRLKFSTGDYTLQVKVQNEWKPMYSFDRQVQYRVDYKLANWYSSCHPDSKFVNNLMVACKSGNGRFTVNNDKFTVYDLKAVPEKRTVATADELIRILEEVFALRVSGLPGITSRLNAIIAAEK